MQGLSQSSHSPGLLGPTNMVAHSKIQGSAFRQGSLKSFIVTRKGGKKSILAEIVCTLQTVEHILWTAHSSEWNTDCSWVLCFFTPCTCLSQEKWDCTRKMSRYEGLTGCQDLPPGSTSPSFSVFQSPQSQKCQAFNAKKRYWSMEPLVGSCKSCKNLQHWKELQKR